ncbi:MAG TPA: XRE family transcriptional regulator [Acidobacteriaceae bacterium]
MSAAHILPNPSDSPAETTDQPLGSPQPIAPETAEAFISEKRIGERIKRLRLKKSMGLVELGRHTGLSASFLSQLETGRVVPTLRNLARISMVFSKDLSYFFESEPASLFRIHRHSERMRLPQTGVDDPTYYFESLGYLVPDRQLDPYRAEFLPLKTGQDVRPHMHSGFEFLYLLDGSLHLQHGDKTHQLEPGDSVYFDAGTSHSYRCAGSTPATALIVTMQHSSAPRAVGPNSIKKAAVPNAAPIATKDEPAAIRPAATRPITPRLSALPSRRLV